MPVVFFQRFILALSSLFLFESGWQKGTEAFAPCVVVVAKLARAARAFKNEPNRARGLFSSLSKNKTFGIMI